METATKKPTMVNIKYATEFGIKERDCKIEEIDSYIKRFKVVSIIEING